jgi:hypothetical protein
MRLTGSSLTPKQSCTNKSLDHRVIWFNAAAKRRCVRNLSIVDFFIDNPALVIACESYSKKALAISTSAY